MPHITIYIPDPTITPSDKILKKAQKKYITIDCTTTNIPSPTADRMQIVVTSTPNKYANNNRCIISAQPPMTKSALAVLKTFLDHPDCKNANADDTTPLLYDEVTVTHLKSVFDRARVKHHMNTLLSGSGVKYSDILFMLYNIIINPFVSAGGTFPFTIFNRDYAKLVFGTHEGLVIWSTVSSAMANYAISLRSIAQLPRLFLKDLKNLLQTLIYDLKKNKIISWKSSKIIGLTATVFLVNAFSIYASITLSQQSTADFAENTHPQPRWAWSLVLLRITEIIGTSALILRSTMGKSIKVALDDPTDIVTAMRMVLFEEMNALLPSNRRLPNNSLCSLAKGQLEQDSIQILGVSYLLDKFSDKLCGRQTMDAFNWTWRNIVATTVQWCSYPLLAASIIYSIAYGLLAADAVQDGYSLYDFFYVTNPFAGFVALMNMVSKGMLLGGAALNITEFVKGLIAKRIINSSDKLSNVLKAGLYAAILTGSGWNTWLSGAKVTEEFLWPNFIFDVVVGIGATAAINYLDQCTVFITLIQKAKTFYLRRCCCTDQTSEEAQNTLILDAISKLASMSPTEFADQYMDRYALGVPADEIEVMQNFLSSWQTNPVLRAGIQGNDALELEESGQHEHPLSATVMTLCHTLPKAASEAGWIPNSKFTVAVQSCRESQIPSSDSSARLFNEPRSERSTVTTATSSPSHRPGSS